MSDNPLEQKPGKVRWAERFLVMFLGVGIATIVVGVVGVVFKGILTGLWMVAAFKVALQLLFFALWAVLVYLIVKGRNWARVTFLILFGLELLFLTMIVVKVPAALWSFINLRGLESIFGLIACVYLLFGETSAWFKAVKAHRKRETQEARSPILTDDTEADDDKIDILFDDVPLYVLQYDGYKHAVRIGFLSFCVVFFAYVVYAALGMDVSAWAVVMVSGMAGVAFIWSAFLLIEALLFKEIHLYPDRMVKVRKLLGTREIGLAHARCVGGSGVLGSPRCLCKQGTGSWIGRLIGINYDEDLAADHDIAEMNGMLAELTGRRKQDFAGVSIDLNRLIEPQPTVSP
jgi:hypothetical protein